ncbi:cupin domain-containing protein [Arthrobacter sp. NQ7]|uniref:cupin domain-containing protein n=1 Tax=Arthrobacter sp. NQ7 TaxID=3032303 RepID=UPI00240EEF29|nr:cupin domain-containing protein [Arthrobacter sp. NQ7]MDJ0459854.1 cupin domain-containing protein [Arthrobacter sp. NQ7]
MTIAFRAADLNASDLEESLLAPPSATPLSGDITVRSRRAFESEDGRIASGTWETETGLSRWEFLNKGEIIHVLSGKMSVQRDGGDEVLLSAGDTAYFPIGWTGTWNVHERLRKVFVVYTA